MINQLKQIGDADIWNTVPSEHLWVTDKCILSKRLGYLCGPGGVSVPYAKDYIVRPVMNYYMMGRGARIQFLSPGDNVEPGYFWCEIFNGRHLSFDYQYGKQVLAVEGFKSNLRLDRFSRWVKINDVFVLPDFLRKIAESVRWFNVECIGDKIIECHFRYNDDFANHNAREIVPIWRDEFYESAYGDRLGFLLKE